MAELPIPVRHACHGENLSPPLAWSQPPQGTQSLVLIMDDPDAVSVAGFVWDHWLLFNIPPDVLSISEGVLADAELPDGSHHGQNSFKQLGYGGPCPPSGQIHRYVFTLYALDTILALEPQVTKDEILEATSGHILGQGELVGTYKSP
jgi:Raf kinase inhibitor-like YbhB/YbcL family protein